MQYPSIYANRLQVLKMSESFSRQVSARLFVQRLKGLSKQELFDQYNIQSDFEMTIVPEPSCVPRSLWYALSLTAYIKNAPADTVFYVREPRLALWLVLVSKRFRKTFFYEAHSLHRFSKRLYTFIFKFSKGLIVTNQIKKDIAIDWGIPAEHISVESNAIDPTRFNLNKTQEQARTELDLPKDRHIILYIGAFTEDRGISTFLQAAVQNTNDAYYFVALGGSDKDVALMQDTYESPHLAIDGRIAYELVPTYMAAASILAAPFSGKYEVSVAQGSPLKIPEYMYATRPFLGTDTPMMRAWLDESVATLVEPDSPEELLAGVRVILDDYEAAVARAQAAHERVRNFTWEARGKRILSFIQTLLA